MAVDYYFGTKGPTITINALVDVWEALDAIHTETINGLGEACEALEALENAMDYVQKLIDKEV